jgi:hypothetical protein
MRSDIASNCARVRMDFAPTRSGDAPVPQRVVIEYNFNVIS